MLAVVAKWWTAAMDGNPKEDIDCHRMAKQATEKVWTIPACEGLGPVTMTLQIPEVRIADSQGRYIVISPKQTAIVSDRLESIDDWLQYGGQET
jgi:hypothetical protein